MSVDPNKGDEFGNQTAHVLRGILNPFFLHPDDKDADFDNGQLDLKWIYHDALSLMTAKDCRQWMIEKDYLKHWMLPQNQLFENEKGLNAYKDWPVGDSPEFMPWDTLLIRDLHCKHLE